MRIGAICRADFTGLGVQSKEFFDNIPCKALVLDLSNYAVPKQNFDWYEGNKVVKVNHIGAGGIKETEILEFIKDIDVLITFEIPYDYRVFELCRESGVKTVLQLNYEFLEYPSFYPKPDLFLAPSMWHWKDIPEPKKFIPVPVNTKHFKETYYKKNTFVHIVGRPAVYNRNGTDTLMKCLKHVKNNIKVIIKSQHNIDFRAMADYIPENVGLIIDTQEKKNYYDNYTGGVLVMPRKYGGLCLPMQEAIAAGMPVITTDIEPNNFWLPKEWLVPASKVNVLHCKKTVDVYEADEVKLAEKIDNFCQKEVYETAVNETKNIKSTISWDNLREQYLGIFYSLIENQ